MNRIFGRKTKGAEKEKKPSFFKRDSTREGLATFADTLVQLRSGVNPGLMRDIRQQRNFDFAQNQYEQRRADRQNEWIEQQQWLRENPKPVNNDTVNDYNFIRQTLGDKQADEFLKNKANPPQYRQGPDGRFYRIDTAQGRPTIGSVIPDPRKAGPASAPGNFQR